VLHTHTDSFFPLSQRGVFYVPIAASASWHSHVSYFFLTAWSKQNLQQFNGLRGLLSNFISIPIEHSPFTLLNFVWIAWTYSISPLTITGFSSPLLITVPSLEVGHCWDLCNSCNVHVFSATFPSPLSFTVTITIADFLLPVPCSALLRSIPSWGPP
jgi:hypothetical protein